MRFKSYFCLISYNNNKYYYINNIIIIIIIFVSVFQWPSCTIYIHIFKIPVYTYQPKSNLT